MDNDFIIRCGQRPVLAALQQTKLDETVNIRMHVFVVSPEGLGQLPYVQPLMDRNAAQQLETLLSNGREQFTQTTEGVSLGITSCPASATCQVSAKARSAAWA